jgi:hypothetical protein
VNLIRALEMNAGNTATAETTERLCATLQLLHMKANFTIKKLEVLYNGKTIDLHNNFDLIRIEHFVKDNSVMLYWIKSTGAWAVSEAYQQVTIIHEGVSFFTILPASGELPIHENSSLEAVTFYPSSNRNENEFFLDQEEPLGEDDIIYAFVGGMTIRVGCDEVILQT